MRQDEIECGPSHCARIKAQQRCLSMPASRSPSPIHHCLGAKICALKATHFGASHARMPRVLIELCIDQRRLVVYRDGRVPGHRNCGRGVIAGASAEGLCEEVLASDHGRLRWWSRGLGANNSGRSPEQWVHLTLEKRVQNHRRR